MDIILLERIEKLGQMGQVVKVKAGFARNYLLPQKKALRATKENLAYFETQRQQLETDNLKHRDEAQQVADRLNGLKVVVIRSAGDTGQLYGSVNARDIATSVTDAGFTVQRSQVVIERPIKALGLFDLRVRLHPEVSANITVNVARSQDEAAEQQRLGHAIVATDGEVETDEERARTEAEAMFEPEAIERVRAEAMARVASGSHRKGAPTKISPTRSTTPMRRARSTAL
jgi:large subunit ribosomal protein L9